MERKKNGWKKEVIYGSAVFLNSYSSPMLDLWTAFQNPVFPKNLCGPRACVKLVEWQFKTTDFKLIVALKEGRARKPPKSLRYIIWESWNSVQNLLRSSCCWNVMKSLKLPMSLGFILRAPWMSEPNFSAIHQTKVFIFLSGPKCRTQRPTVHRARLKVKLPGKLETCLSRTSCLQKM